MNGDLRDMCPPLGGCKGGCGGSASALYEQLGTHPRQPALLFVCVRVNAYAIVGDDRGSWLPRVHVATKAAAAAASVDQLLLHLRIPLFLVAQ